MLKCLPFFTLPDYYLMISESRYAWCDRYAWWFQCLAFPCVNECPHGSKMGIWHHLEIETKNQKFLET